MHDTGNQFKALQSSYELLARLYLREPDMSLASELGELPGFADIVPPRDELPAWLEEEGAEYQRLFGMNAYPYQSLFMDRELMLNTAAADRVALLYRECGFDPSPYKVGAPDHLGLELSLMSDLIAIDHRATSLPSVVAVWARQQQAWLLREHLARWVPVYTSTLERIARRPLHRMLATLTVDLVLTDLGALPQTEERQESPDPSPPPQERTAPAAGQEHDRESPAQAGPYGGPEEEPGADQSEEERGMNSIVRQLITPVDAGIFITRADITRFARSLDLPAPIGDRFQMTRSLFQAAGQFEQLLQLLDALDSLLAQAQQSYAELAEAYPAWTAYAVPWQERTTSTRRLLAEMQVQAADSQKAAGLDWAQPKNRQQAKSSG